MVLTALFLVLICTWSVSIQPDVEKYRIWETTDSIIQFENDKCDAFNGSSFAVSGSNGRLGNQLGLMAIIYPLYLKWKVKITLDDFQFSLLANTFDLSQVCSDIPGQYLCSNYMEGETFEA